MSGGVNAAIFYRVRHAVDHIGIAVTQDDRAEAQSVIDVAVLIGIEYITFLAADENVSVVFAPVTEVRIDAVWKDFLGALK